MSLDGMERVTVPYAIVAETWIEEDADRFRVKYRHEGMLSGERTKAIIPKANGRERAENVAEHFDGTWLERRHFIP